MVPIRIDATGNQLPDIGLGLADLHEVFGRRLDRPVVHAEKIRTRRHPVDAHGDHAVLTGECVVGIDPQIHQNL